MTPAMTLLAVIKSRAESATNRLAKQFGWSPGQANAFRHAYWMAMIAKRYGKDWAVGLGRAHERDTAGKHRRDSEADRINNKLYIPSVVSPGTHPGIVIFKKDGSLTGAPREVKADAGMMTITKPSQCSRRWMAKAVWLCSRPSIHVFFCEMTFPVKNVTRGYSVATFLLSAATPSTTSVSISWK